jgi:hypothetical protein
MSSRFGSQWTQLAKTGTRSQAHARSGYDFGLSFRQINNEDIAVIEDLNAFPN